jgi:hypothetical protein
MTIQIIMNFPYDFSNIQKCNLRVSTHLGDSFDYDFTQI